MKKLVNDMTGEEFAKYYRKRHIRMWILYILVISLIVVAKELSLRFIEPLQYYDMECLAIFIEIEKVIIVTSFILIGITLLVFIIVICLRYGRLNAIYSSECDPEKYLEAEAIICKKSYFGRRSKRQKCMVGNAYAALKDYENARKFYSEVVPKDINRCSDIFILSGLASYYFNSGDKEESYKYLARLEALKASGKKSATLDIQISHLQSAKAIHEKRFDDARVFIDAYKDRPRLPKSMQAITEYNLGEIEFEEKNYFEAIYRYRRAVELGGKFFFVQDARDKLKELEDHVA